MQEALVKGKQITVQRYIEDCGELKVITDAEDAKSISIPICPECKKRMRLRAQKRGNRDAHFAHVRNSGPCPIKEAAAAPYRVLRPTKPDEHNARLIRHFVRDNWVQVFRAMAGAIPKLTVKEFIAVLARATSNNVWAYTNLMREEIPGLLCCLADFPDGDGRLYWPRFWYSGAQRRPEGLWINPKKKGTLQRGSYFPLKGGKRPGKQHICRVTPIAFPDDFLTVHYKRPNEGWRVDEWFKRRPKLFML